MEGGREVDDHDHHQDHHGCSAEGEAGLLPEGEMARRGLAATLLPHEDERCSVSSPSRSLSLPSARITPSASSMISSTLRSPSLPWARDTPFASFMASSRSSSFSQGSYADNDDGSSYGVAQQEVEERPSFRWLRWWFSPPRGGADGKTMFPDASPVPAHVNWERLLPFDYDEIVARAVSPVNCSSTQELYLRLCEPILIDKGMKILWLERPTGKKCYMLSARAIQIIEGDDSRRWRWNISAPGARFPKVAKMVDASWLEIKACIRSRDLSPGTWYNAYLVMRLSGSSYGLKDPPLETVHGFGRGSPFFHTQVTVERTATDKLPPPGRPVRAADRRERRGRSASPSREEMGGWSWRWAASLLRPAAKSRWT